MKIKKVVFFFSPNVQFYNQNIKKYIFDQKYLIFSFKHCSVKIHTVIDDYLSLT